LSTRMVVEKSMLYIVYNVKIFAISHLNRV
jgi:hypothetical protein